MDAARESLTEAGETGDPLPEVRRLSPSDLKEPPPESFILGRAIPLGKATVIFGPSGIGKSALASQIVFAFAAGANTLWGLPMHSTGPVLVVTAEDSMDDWRRKAAAAQVDGSFDVAGAIPRIAILDLSEGVARLTETVTVRSGDTTRRIFQPTPLADQIIALTYRLAARLVLVETVSRLVEEEDNPAFSALMSGLGRIARETGAAVLVSHHPSKASARENETTIEAARGGGALTANARNVLGLFPADDETAAQWSHKFPKTEMAVLLHLKSTSSTRPNAPTLLARTDAKFGAAFRLPDEAFSSPEAEAAATAKRLAEQERERTALVALHRLVGELSQSGPVSANRLRPHSADLGVTRHGVDPLVRRALKLGVLRSGTRPSGGRGVALEAGVLGVQP